MPVPNFNLPADLPQDWTNGQIVSPDGTSVGLSKQHGFNTLNQYVNDAQKAINQLRSYLESAGFATQESLDTAVSRLLPKSGGTMTGIINHGNKRATNIATPTAATDGATKGYVDTAVSGFSGLLTGGSIRKIWAGAVTSGTSQYPAVPTNALILNDTMAFFIAPDLGSTKGRMPVFLANNSGIAIGNSSICSFYPESGLVNGNVLFRSGLASNDYQTVDGVDYVRYTVSENYIIPSDVLAIVMIYCTKGFVYAD